MPIIKTRNGIIHESTFSIKCSGPICPEKLISNKRRPISVETFIKHAKDLGWEQFSFGKPASKYCIDKIDWFCSYCKGDPLIKYLESKIKYLQVVINWKNKPQEILNFKDAYSFMDNFSVNLLKGKHESIVISNDIEGIVKDIIFSDK